MIHEFDLAVRRYAEERLCAAPEPAVRRPGPWGDGARAAGVTGIPGIPAANRAAPPGILRVLETTWRLWREPLA